VKPLFWTFKSAVIVVSMMCSSSTLQYIPNARWRNLVRFDYQQYPVEYYILAEAGSSEVNYW